MPAGCFVRLPDGVSFEVGAIMSDAVATAYHAVCKRAALPPLTAFVGKELSVIGSMGSYREDLGEVLALLAHRELNLAGSVTHRFGLDEINTALETLARKTGDPVRVVVTP